MAVGLTRTYQDKIILRGAASFFGITLRVLLWYSRQRLERSPKFFPNGRRKQKPSIFSSLWGATLNLLSGAASLYALLFFCLINMTRFASSYCIGSEHCMDNRPLFAITFSGRKNRLYCRESWCAYAISDCKCPRNSLIIHNNVDRLHRDGFIRSANNCIAATTKVCQLKHRARVAIRAIREFSSI
jgi:hypothetical protein